MGDAPNPEERPPPEQQPYIRGRRRRCSPNYDGPATSVQLNRLPRLAREDANRRIRYWYIHPATRDDCKKKYRPRRCVVTKKQRRMAARLGVRRRQLRLRQRLLSGLPGTGRFWNKMLDANGNIVDRPREKNVNQTQSDHTVDVHSADSDNDTHVASNLNTSSIIEQPASSERSSSTEDMAGPSKKSSQHSQNSSESEETTERTQSASATSQEGVHSSSVRRIQCHRSNTVVDDNKDTDVAAPVTRSTSGRHQ